MVPLSIIRRKDMKRDGSASAILERYGAYGISYTPGFNVRHSLALHGVVLGYCHPRGGSEKGEASDKAGAAELRRLADQRHRPAPRHHSSLATAGLAFRIPWRLLGPP